MSEQSSQEPTMEEILASIRRIISEDETPEGAAAAPAAEAAAPPQPDPAPEPEPVAAAPEPEPAPVAAAPAPVQIEEEEEEEEALELTQKVESHDDLDILAPPEPAPPPPAATLVSEQVAAVAAASFDKLSATIAMPEYGRTLEDVVREMLRPMLQQWLDDNLPGIVQEAVQAEVERISRSRVR